MEKLKILMLGPKETGKTTFMMTTYGLMASEGIQGFTVKSRDEVQHKQLMRAFHGFRRTGEYPAPTVQMANYQYAFYVDGEGILDFELTDMRGESISDYDTNELRRKIQASDVIMLFLNGYNLVNDVDMADELYDLYALINASMRVDEKRVMIMPIFTQMDRLDELTEREFEILKAPVQPLIDAEKENENLWLNLVPTACAPDCLMDLDYAIVLMMFFGYTAKIVERRQEMEAELESIRCQYGESLWRNVVEFIDFFEISSVAADRRRARQRAQELQKDIEAYERMTSHLERLQVFLQDYELGTSYRLKRPKYSDLNDPYSL